jgi:predicted GNAT superfamily acetyltransferase
MERRLIEDAWRLAAETAATSGVTVRPLDTVAEIAVLDSVLTRVWGGTHIFLPVELTRALAFSGNYVVGAFAGGDGRIVGGSLGFFGEHGGRRHLHSHITGVLPGLQGGALGYAIKVHQRAWSLEAGLDEVVWTFDPLVRRNAYFNLAKLGAVMAGYETDFYGDALDDEFNRGDESDRGVIRWSINSGAVVERLTGGREARPPDETGHTDPDCILSEDDEGDPRPVAVEPDGRPLRAWVPADIVAVRRDDPDRARAWRRALRETVGAAIAGGYVAVGMSRDGWYRLELPETESEP